MRLFIAIDIPPSDILADLETDLGKTGKGIKPTRQENQHITCKFIGEPPCGVDEIVTAVEDAGSNIDPFVMKASGYGAFPGWKRPSVLWIGFDNVEPLKELATVIDRTLERVIGIPAENREFRAHLTIARTRGPVNTRRARDILENGVNALIKEEYSIPVEDFHLYSSDLTPNGPIYSRLKTFSLGE